MIIHERYCKRCHKITNHRELKKDYYECIKCRVRSIETHEIKEDGIDAENPSYYLYVQGEFIFFNDILDANVTTKTEIKKLLNGDALRIPMYRVKN